MSDLRYAILISMVVCVGYANSLVVRDHDSTLGRIILVSFLGGVAAMWIGMVIR